MQLSPKIKFKDLKRQIADAIKEACYKIDARYYNIANAVDSIVTFSVEPGVEIAKDLSKIIDQTIKESMDLDCDLSVIVKGILIGAFRASPFMREEAHKTIRILIEEIFGSVLKYKGDIKLAIQGTITAVVIIAKEFKLNAHEALMIARENILAATKETGFADEIKEALSDLDNSL